MVEIDALGDMGDFQPPLPKADKYIDNSFWDKALKSVK